MYTPESVPVFGVDVATRRVAGAPWEAELYVSLSYDFSGGDSKIREYLLKGGNQFFSFWENHVWPWYLKTAGRSVWEWDKPLITQRVTDLLDFWVVDATQAKTGESVFDESRRFSFGNDFKDAVQILAYEDGRDWYKKIIVPTWGEAPPEQIIRVLLSWGV